MRSSKRRSQPATLLRQRLLAAWIAESGADD